MYHYEHMDYKTSLLAQPTRTGKSALATSREELIITAIRVEGENVGNQHEFTLRGSCGDGLASRRIAFLTLRLFFSIAVSLHCVNSRLENDLTFSLLAIVDLETLEFLKRLLLLCLIGKLHETKALAPAGVAPAPEHDMCGNYMIFVLGKDLTKLEVVNREW